MWSATRELSPTEMCVVTVVACIFLIVLLFLPGKK